MKKLDLTGRKFGMLKVRGLEYTTEKYVKYWKCECECGNSVTVSRNHLRSGHTTSCGCKKNRKGPKHNDESKLKISEARKGMKFSAEHLKNLSEAHKGNKHSEETLKKMVESQNAIKHKNNYWLGKTGKKHNRYNPNLTDVDRVKKRNIPEYIDWVKAVYKKDNYTCQCCGQHSGKLNAHHIESYRANPKLRTTLSNGITLCEDCHKEFHHRYGYGNNTRAQLIEFLRGKYFKTEKADK